jgi:RNA polymerase sigma factor (TIGR02999 family)
VFPDATVPDPSTVPNLTLLLNRMRKGGRVAGDQVATLVYGELHRIAAREMRREPAGHTLQTTALVHEAYLRLAGAQSLQIQDRAHFFALAARQMRRVLVDHARSSRAQRRGGGAFALELKHVGLGTGEPNVDVLLLNECLDALERLDPRAAHVVELRYFGGFTDHEVAEATSASLSTIRRDWEFARSWLYDRMRGNVT